MSELIMDTMVNSNIGGDGTSVGGNSSINPYGNPTSGTNSVDKIVESVTNASKRLSQISTNTTNSNKIKKGNNKIGPWKLGRTLGKGSTGRVRLAKNINTGKLAAIKILPKANFKKLENPKYKKPAGTDNDELPYGIEREIIIMKLINHQNIMGLYDVWENKNDLYLILEYIEGGELFDYLIKRGKLQEYEAVNYFKQIVNGISYLHQFNICHRDLKPENLLLDFNKNIKIADFGMAALEISDKLLETSCGSPHYASPEIVAGKNYHGAPSDIWSCGIILFALLTGYLPFDDENIRKLLLKVQNGKYIMPSFLSVEAKDLINRMLQVNPDDRITMPEIWSHPLLTKYPNPKNYNPWLNQQINLKSINLRKLDREILSNLVILFHNCDEAHIINQLSQSEMNSEKLFYFLLMKYRNNHTDNPNPNPKAKQQISRNNSNKSLGKIVVSNSFNKKKPMAFNSNIINREPIKSASNKSIRSLKSIKSMKSIKSGLHEIIDKENIQKTTPLDTKVQLGKTPTKRVPLQPKNPEKRNVSEPTSLDPRIAGINSLLRAKSLNTPSSYVSLRHDHTGKVLAKLGIQVPPARTRGSMIKTSSSRTLNEFLKFETIEPIQEESTKESPRVVSAVEESTRIEGPPKPKIKQELNDEINNENERTYDFKSKPYKSLLSEVPNEKSIPKSDLPKLPTNKEAQVLKPITNTHTNINYKKGNPNRNHQPKITEVKVESQSVESFNFGRYQNPNLIPNPRFSRFSFNGLLNQFEIRKDEAKKPQIKQEHELEIKEEISAEPESKGDEIIKSLKSNGTVLRKSPRSNLNILGLGIDNEPIDGSTTIVNDDNSITDKVNESIKSSASTVKGSASIRTVKSSVSVRTVKSVVSAKTVKTAASTKTAKSMANSSASVKTGKTTDSIKSGKSVPESKKGDDEFITVNIDDDTNYTNNYSTLMKNAIDESSYNFINFSQDTLTKEHSFRVDKVLDDRDSAETIKPQQLEAEDEPEEAQQFQQEQEQDQNQGLEEQEQEQEQEQEAQEFEDQVLEDQDQSPEEQEFEDQHFEDYDDDDFEKENSFATEYNISNVNIGKFNKVQPNLVQSSESLEGNNRDSITRKSFTGKRTTIPQPITLPVPITPTIPTNRASTRTTNSNLIPKRTAPSVPRNWFQKLFNIEQSLTVSTINSNLTSTELFRLINKTLMLKKIEGTLKNYNVDEEFGLIDGVIPNKFGKLKFKIEIIDMGRTSSINLIKVKGSDKNFKNLIDIVDYMIKT